jgi:mono/diheme cytochrome c family protein
MRYIGRLLAGRGPAPQNREAGLRPAKFATALLLLSIAVLSACSSIQRDPPTMIWWDMKRQPKFRTEGETGLFADGRNTRIPPEDTVAQGYLFDETAYNTGMVGPMYVGKNPVPVTADLLHQGQFRFNTYCVPCHDRTGSGHGIVPAHAPQWQPANLLEDRVVELADGDIFTVITNGRRTMPPYKYQIVTADRWAIIAYLRVLQRAAHSTVADVPADQRAALQ